MVNVGNYTSPMDLMGALSPSKISWDQKKHLSFGTMFRLFCCWPFILHWKIPSPLGHFRPPHSLYHFSPLNFLGTSYHSHLPTRPCKRLPSPAQGAIYKLFKAKWIPWNVLKFKSFEISPSSLAGGFSPPNWKICSVVKLDHETPSFRVKMKSYLKPPPRHSILKI